MTLCVALGLWIHNQFIIAAARWDASESANASLSRAATWMQSHDTLSNVGAFDASFADAPHQNGDIVCLFDQAGQQVWSNQSKTYSHNVLSNWQSSSAPTGDFFISKTTLEGINCLAIRWVRPNAAGTGVIFRPTNRINFTAEQFKQALPGAAIIAMLWIAALQGGIIYMVLSRLQNETKRRERESDGQALQHARALVRTQDAIILGMAKLAESRDTDTGMHLERISLFATKLATAMQMRYPQFREELNLNFVRLIGSSSALHDIGKVGVEDSILKKPGRLTDDERIRMQEHTIIGSECLKQIEKRLGSTNFLQMAREICTSHHEWWDGSGYPHKLAGEQIPLAARIVSVVDVYDALANARVYKPAFPHQRCVDIIKEGAGTQFDPLVVEAFIAISGQFQDIIRRYGEKHVEAESPNPAAVAVLESVANDDAHPLIAAG